MGLKLVEASLADGLVRVTGKGQKERVVPVGEEERLWLQRYLGQARPGLLRGRSADALFVTRRGGPMTRQMFWKLVRVTRCWPTSARRCRRMTAPCVRHPSAQPRCGPAGRADAAWHADISTTQIYTHVARERLQALHERHHPRG